jgi:hypothetical protein
VDGGLPLKFQILDFRLQIGFDFTFLDWLMLLSLSVFLRLISNGGSYEQELEVDRLHGGLFAAGISIRWGADEVGCGSLGHRGAETLTDRA